MADAESIARYLGVSSSRVPGDPEGLDDPKGAMVNLARHSRRKSVREDMIPGEKSRRRVGPAYPGRLIEYTTTKWRPDIAAQRSESLQRAINCLCHLVRRRTGAVR